jgi:hypothetical protein
VLVATEGAILGGLVALLFATLAGAAEPWIGAVVGHLDTPSQERERFGSRLDRDRW